MPIIKINIYIFLVEAICMCVYIVKLPPDTLPQWRQFGWRQCDLRPFILIHQPMPLASLIVSKYLS